MASTLNYSRKTQSGFTLIEMMIVVAIIGVISAIAVASYQTQVRKTQIIMIYHTLNDTRIPYEILVNDGEGVRGFSPDGLNMPEQTKYCQLSVTAPVADTVTLNALSCQIQNLSYLSNQTLSLDRDAAGSWSCRASAGIQNAYLPVECQ